MSAFGIIIMTSESVNRPKVRIQFVFFFFHSRGFSVQKLSKNAMTHVTHGFAIGTILASKSYKISRRDIETNEKL